MLHNLNIDVMFATGKAAGRPFVGSCDFKEGMTGIFGDNEAGKSLRFEMVRFALFGSKALRGSTSDFKKLNVSLKFEVKGNVYVVSRTLKEALLMRGTTQIASGTTPVNATIVKMFGYGLEVFDIANASLQDETQALTNMKPTARKQMVDRVIGLDALEKVSKLFAEEASNIRTAADSLRRMVVELQEPVKPEGYRESAVVSDQIKDRRVLVEEKRNLEAKLAAMKCAEPVAPSVTITETIESLTAKKVAQEGVTKRIAELKAELAGIPDTKLLEEATMLQEGDLALMKAYLETDVPEQYDEYNAYAAEAKRYPGTKQTSEQYEAALYLKERDDATARAERLRCESTVDCPHCQKGFSLQQSKLDDILKPFADVSKQEALAGDFYKEFDVTTLRNLKAQALAYEAFMARPAPAQPTEMFRGRRSFVEHLVLNVEAFTRDQAARQRKAKEIAEAEKLATDTTNYSALILTAKEEAAAVQRYQMEKEKHAAYVEYAASVEGRLLQLQGVEVELSSLESELTRSLAFEQQQAVYAARLEEQSRIKAEIMSHEDRLERIKLIQKTLTDLKPRVKSYLMPSLNSVASNFLSQMTNGVRNSVVINEEFDILVDGQRVETLSGSGKAVVNLAIRIALGTVLTNKVFSVFMADEVDAAMRGERAAYTAQCLKNLTQVIKQILIISHKEIEVDHRILI